MARSTPLQKTKSGKLASKKSKTGDPRCSQAASQFARGQATSETYKLLGECRSKARMQGQAKLQREAGNEGKAQVLEKRAERGLTGKDRIAKAKELIAQRKAKIDTQVAAKATTAKPSLREQADAARAKKGTRYERMKSIVERSTSQADSLSARRTAEVDKVVGPLKAMDKEFRKTKSPEARAAIQAKADAMTARLRSLAGRERIATDKAKLLTESFRYDKQKAATAPMKKRAARNLALLKESLATSSVAIPSMTKVKWLTDPSQVATNPFNEIMVAPTPKGGFLATTREQANAMLRPVRAAKARELLAQRAAAKPTPSPRDQAATARTAKGDRSTRLKALADKAMAIAERRATKANSLTGAAQDRMLDRSMASAQRYNQLEAARTPFTPASKATPAKAPGRGTPERLARVEAAKNALFGKRLDREFTKLDAPKGRNFQGLDKVRAALPYKSDEFVARLREQRKAGRYSLDSYEGAAGSLPERLKAAAIMEGGRPMTFLSRRDAQPYTPRAKATPSLREQAAAARAAKGSRSERVASIMQKMDSKYTAASRKSSKIGEQIDRLHKQTVRLKAERKDTSGLVTEMMSLNDTQRKASRLRQRLEARAGKIAKVARA